MAPRFATVMFETYGRYQLLKKLAAGGMGEVFLARQQGMQGFEKLMVVKRVLAQFTEEEEFINMFLDEARLTARFNHPNIAQIYDLGQEGDTYYLAMEYVHGEDVRRVWKKVASRSERIPPGLVARIIADAAAGLDFAHKAVDDKGQPLGIIHRDVSPQNILVTFEGGVKLIDFGVAKAAGRLQSTATGVLKGKYAYMSPEQAAGEAMDHRSDVFALGIVAYEMFTDQRLFKRDSDTQTLRAITDCEVAPPSRLAADLPKSLDLLLMKSLAKKPERRYGDCQAMRLAFEEWIAASRQPGSAAHLAQFMTELYADRLAEERKLGHPPWDEQTPARTPAPAAGSQGQTARARGQPSGAAAEDKATRVLEEPRRRRWALPVALVGLVVGGGAAAYLVASGRAGGLGAAEGVWISTDPAYATVMADGRDLGPGPRVRLEGKRGTIAMVTARAEGHQDLTRRVEITADGKRQSVFALERSKPAEPAKVTIHVESKPLGADVLADGEKRCATPCDVAVPRGMVPVTVTVKKDGFAAETRPVLVDGDSKQYFELKPAAKLGKRPTDIQLKR